MRAHEDEFLTVVVIVVARSRNWSSLETHWILGLLGNTPSVLAAKNRRRPKSPRMQRAHAISKLLIEFTSCMTTGSTLRCYECHESDDHIACGKQQKAVECKQGWSCMTVKELPLGKPKPYFRRTCAEEDVCRKFCKNKKECKINCCRGNLCNNIPLEWDEVTFWRRL